MTDQVDLPPAAYAKMAADEYAFARADAAERVKVQASIADAGMKALMLANGGAMIALFTFVGNLVAKASTPIAVSADRLWVAFICFVVGLSAALLCHVAAFASQDRFYNQAMVEAWRQQEAAANSSATTVGDREAQLNAQGMWAYAAALGLSVLAIVAFMAGCGFALSGVLVAA